MSVTVGFVLLAGGSTVAAQASSTPHLSGTATITGTYCVSVNATTDMAAPADYTLSVTHS